MKLKRKQWLQVAALATQEGYEGPKSDVEQVRKFLTDDACINTLTVDGISVDLTKALSVEMSDDQTQALITEGGGQQQQQPAQQQQQQPPPPPQQNSMDLSDAKIKASIQSALEEMGVDLVSGKRPQTVRKDEVKNLGPRDEIAFESKIKRGRTCFSNARAAKAFDAYMKAEVLRSKGKFNEAKAHEDYLEKVAKSVGIDTKAMATSPGSVGGALTEMMWEPELIRLVEEYGIITRLVGFRETSEQTVILKRRTGGPTVYHPNENSAITESSPTYDNVQLTMKTAAALTQISNQTLRYASPDAGDEAAKELAWTFAKYIDDSVFSGDGSAGPAALGTTLPGREGLYNKFGSSATDGGYVVVGGDTTTVHTATHLAALLGRLPLYARRGAVITGSPEKLEMTFGRLGRASGGVTMGEWQGTQVTMFAGIPLIPNLSDVNGSETTGASPADQIDCLYGRFEDACKIYRSGGLEVETSTDRYFDQHATAIRATMEWDFVIHDVGTSSVAGPVVSFWQT